MDFKELQQQSEAELTKLLAETRTAYQHMRVKARLGQVKKFSELQTLRKRIAHILTLLHRS
jgi:ribosomal protein L29